MVTFVETDYTEPYIRYTLIGTAGGNDPDTGDIYRGLDRFGRIKDSYWYDYGSSSDVDRIKYGYDRSGNRLWRENVVARSLGKYFDEKHLYDEIHRLKDMERGELTSGESAITNLQFAQCWGLDETGNWSNFREDDDGDGSWDLNQNRMANKVNEITNVTESTGPSWTTPAYSAAGNMTTVPKPADPTASFTATYDAWNRLTKLVDTTSSDTVAEYEYDGAKRRVIQKSYTAGTLDETRHLYYTEPSKWQVIEERVDPDTHPNRQFIWGLRYIDDLILRDRDTTGNGTLDERLYALQDANWNVTAVTDTVGSVQQRMTYQAYGTPQFLTATFVWGANSEGWETLYAGYRFDLGKGLYYVRHRVLHTRAGAWCQRDFLGMAAGINIYRYGGSLLDVFRTHSNPLILTDPLGLTSANCQRILQLFSNWVRQQQAIGLEWLNALRLIPCPCTLTLRRKKVGKKCVDTFSNPNSHIWEDPSSGSLTAIFHPGAAVCMRSRPGATTNSAGEQCCYDSSGELITHGQGAGTPDMSNPGDRPASHQVQDVWPYNWAVFLDGCFPNVPPGYFLSEYHRFRPPSQGAGSRLQPCPRNPA